VHLDGFIIRINSFWFHEVICITQVCLGDRIIIDLKNKLVGSELSIHWHGVFQKGKQYMDGVPMVTQCAILEGDVFRYDFLANNEGTHYWHSHDGKDRRS
jgi:FtsP/CotA-like multicopper oxidase with cupredoxin domain